MKCDFFSYLTSMKGKNKHAPSHLCLSSSTKESFYQKTMPKEQLLYVIQGSAVG